MIPCVFVIGNFYNICLSLNASKVIERLYPIMQIIHWVIVYITSATALHRSGSISVAYMCNVCIFGKVTYKRRIRAQLFSTNAFSANTFSLNVLPCFTAIYSQSIVSTNNFFTYFYQRKQISRK